jgi:outer membrane receptor protein involved in Fe transport
MRSLRSFALAIWVALAVAAPARAQAPPGSEPETTDRLVLPPVVVRAPARLPTAPLPQGSVPNAVQIITGDEIRASGAPNLQEFMMRLPGVTTNDAQGNRVQPDLTFRGFQVTSVTGVPQGISVFVDGVRVNEPTVEEVNFDLLPLEDIEQIEVIRGPSPVFGRNTLGGSINIITRRGAEVREIVPEVQGGSFGRQMYRLRVGGTLSKFDYYVSGTYDHEDGWRDRSEVRLGKLFAKLGFRLDGTDVTVSFQRAQNRIEQPGSLPESELRRDRRQNFTGGDFFSPLLNLATLNIRQNLSPTAAVTVNFFGRTLDAEQFNVNLVDANSRLFTHTTSVGGTVQFDHDTTLAGRNNRLTLGLENVYHGSSAITFLETADRSSRVLDSDVFDRQQGFAVYAQDTFEILKNALRDGDSLVLTLGVRWDWLHHEISDDSPRGADEPSAGGSSTFSKVNPKFGLNYNVSRSSGVYFTFAQGFRAPAFLELTCASPGLICPGLQAGTAQDPPLNAVKVNHYEIGGRARPLPWLGIEGAFYRTDVFDDIFAVSPTGTTGLFFQNVGNTRRQGLEVEAHALIAQTWEPRLSYTYTRATFRDDLELATPRQTAGCVVSPCTQQVRAGNDLPLIPRHRVNASLDYHATPWLTLWISGSYVGSQRLRGDEANVERTLPPYTVVNAGARLHWKSLAGFVTINNLLDNEYETFGTFAPNAKAPGAPIEPFLTPAPPLRFTAGISYRF